MQARDIARARLWGQGLADARLPSPSSVVRWLGAMQSQEYAVAKWSVGQRTFSATDTELDRALAEGAILRTHLLRPTWHFVAADDLRWMLELTGPRVQKFNTPYYRQFELDDDVLVRSASLLAAALDGGHQLTRKEVASILEEAGVRAEGTRLALILMHAELSMIICSGALREKQHTYALFDERVPAQSSLPRDEALARLTEVYFTSRGPATLKDFRWWSGLNAADAKRGTELAGAQIERRTIEDRVYWGAPSSWSVVGSSTEAHLLQAYDEYIIAYAESRSVIDAAGIAKRASKGQTLFTHALIVDGQVVGHWRRTTKAKGVTIDVRPMRKLTKSERGAVQAAGDRYGAFLELPVTIR